MGKPRRLTFWQALKERRVLPLLGLYLGASWVAVEFLGFLVDRYRLSPYLIDLVLLVLGTLLPAAVVLAWTHGKPGPDQWTRLDKVVLPANLALTVGLVLILFSGRDLGAITEVVTAEDETGARIERVIPKASFRKQAALYFFANESSDSEADWVRRWIPMAIYLDLIQDAYFDNRSPFQLSADLMESGAQLGDAPLALKREIARKLHLTYFLDGAVRGLHPFVLETRLYRTDRGRLLARHHYDGFDLGELVDRIAVDMKADLGVSPGEIDAAQDLPVAALSSDDPGALARFIDGMMQLSFHRDWAAAARSLMRAVDADPTFALAQFYLYQTNLLLGTESGDAIDAAMHYLYKVPERLQGAIKEVYYTWRGEPEKALAVLRLDVTLFPDDIIAHRRLANFYRKTAYFVEALGQYEFILELDPADELVLRDIANIHGALGHFEEALASLQTYSDQYPRDVEALLETGEIYQLLGRLADAEQVYDRAALLAPQGARVMMLRASLHFQQGALEAALRLARQAADAAQTVKAEVEALTRLAGHYESLGRIKEAMQVIRQAIPGERKLYGPAGSAVLRLKHFNLYALTTMADSAEALLADMDVHLPSPWNDVLDVMQIYFRLSRENPAITDREMEQVEAFYQEYKLLVDVPGELMNARIRESRGEYRQAIHGYIAALSRYPKRLMVQRHVARCYRQLGDEEAALATIRELLAVYPNDPAALYEQYRILRGAGADGAQIPLHRLAAIWAEADEVYLPARDVRQALGAEVRL